MNNQQYLTLTIQVEKVKNTNYKNYSYKVLLVKIKFYTDRTKNKQTN